MTDNLKQRIAEALRPLATRSSPNASQYVIEQAAQAVLDIVEPLLPKWATIESAPTNYTGTMLFYNRRHGFKRVSFNHKYNTWYEDYACLPLSHKSTIDWTHYYILPQPPTQSGYELCMGCGRQIPQGSPCWCSAPQASTRMGSILHTTECIVKE